MSTKDINITNIDILSLHIQRNCLLEILEAFDNDILNEESLYSSAIGDSDYIQAGIKATLKTIEQLIQIAETSNEPNQLNEANWDKD